MLNDFYVNQTIRDNLFVYTYLFYPSLITLFVKGRIFFFLQKVPFYILGFEILKNNFEYNFMPGTILSNMCFIYSTKKNVTFPSAFFSLLFISPLINIQF